MKSGTAIAQQRPIACQPPKLCGSLEQDDPATVLKEQTTGIIEKKNQDATFHDAKEIYPEVEVVDVIKTLGHCTDVVLDKAIPNTTQYFNLSVEPEQRKYPCQHHN